MAIKKAKLNYVSAVSHTPPAVKIPVSSKHMIELNASIKQKVKQNHWEQIESEKIANQYVVR